MSEDIFDRRATHRTRARLETARTAGAWLPWAGASLALLYWAGIAAWLYVTLGADGIKALSPLLLAGGGAAVFVPGVALMVAGVMARESSRSSEANAVVLASARLLLEPAEYARDGITSIAEALTEMRSRMDGLRHDIEASVTGALKAAEIVRADSEVLVQKMSSERQSLNQLSESLRNQAEGLARAIPRYAQTMTEAARIAQAEVAKADETLDQRLRSVEDAARRLGERIDQLDTMGAESRKRAQNLAGSLARMDEQLVQSTRMVDAAVRAGELATAASKGTADSLRDAMSDALGSALKVSETIAAQSAAASEDARGALTRLKEVGLQAEATTRSATMAVKAQADETEQRINQLSEFLFRAASKATQMTEGGLEKARERIERASVLVKQIKGEEHGDSSVEDLWLDPTSTAARPETFRPAMTKPTASADFEIAMREAGAPDDVIVAHRASMARPASNSASNSANNSAHNSAGNPASVSAPAPLHAPAAPQPRPQPQAVAPLIAPLIASVASAFTPPAPPPPTLSAIRAAVQSAAPPVQAAPVQAAPVPAPPVQAPPVQAPPAQAPVQASVQPHAPGGSTFPNPFSVVPPSAPLADPSRNSALSWRDLLTGIEEVDPDQREETVSTVIDHLNRAGVKLTHIVRASDLRRIATASHQGERQRRRAIRDVAPAEIQRVSRLLDADSDLQQAARTFVAVEEPDALRVLATAERAREDAAPRLSAYLLLDAALGTMI